MVLEDAIKQDVMETQDLLMKRYPTLKEAERLEAIAIYENTLRGYIESVREDGKHEPGQNDIEHYGGDMAWTEMESHLNSCGCLLFIDFEFFLEDYKTELECFGEFEQVNDKFLSFVMQQERPYIQKLFDALTESVECGENAFYHRESKMERLAFQCVEYRLLGYVARFEQEKDTV
ncbi:hypothetical protein [Listeria booriae]|uniref:Uncharacterized protein n=1 Tax=Listeria booriae TaxID=1552123 RepID=A0A841ZWV1_9LIST|nr:hypothetical protein [Listeria booriae]MBC1565076.1 hypothetical protein [Listeria booriae]